MRSAPALPSRADESTVSTLELFFDLVFVLAITQCTALMASDPTWTGVARGLVLLGLLWWSWVGYAWLTSVVNPEHVSVRLPIFAAMASLAVAGMCIPHAFDYAAGMFVAAYAAVRIGQIALFALAAPGDPNLARSVAGLGASTAIGCSLLVVGVLASSSAQLWIWAVALLLDMLGPFVTGAEGWRLAPSHFAERHGLIGIIALGESLIAIGVGARHPEHLEVVAAVVLGAVTASALWWVYFDVLAIVAERALHRAEPGLERNTLARDAYSYLHLPLVAGVVLIALGMKKSVGHPDLPLELVPSAALFGGAAVVMAGMAAFAIRATRWRPMDNVLVAVVLAALVPVGTRIDALLSMTVLAVLLVGLVISKAVRFGPARQRVRRGILTLDDRV